MHLYILTIEGYPAGVFTSQELAAAAGKGRSTSPTGATIATCEINVPITPHLEKRNRPLPAKDGGPETREEAIQSAEKWYGRFLELQDRINVALSYIDSPSISGCPFPVSTVAGELRSILTGVRL
jgi:hypothetical protein